MSDIPVSTGAKRKASEDLEDSSDKKTKMVAEEDSENDTEDDDEDRDGDTDDHVSDHMEDSEEDYDDLSHVLDDMEGSEDDSDEESKQYDVEEYQHTLPSSRVVDLKLYISKDELGGDWSDWTYDIVVECKYKGEVIGTAFGRYIDRRPIRNNFYVNMEEVAHEMSELAFEIFDRYGYLKTELKEHPVRKGTGAFGEEMDHGGLLLFERIHLQMEWRRQGLGTVMVKALLKKAEEQKQGLRFAVSLPGNLNTSDLDDELKGKTKRERLFITDREFDTAVSFIRALGFRRIGGAIWFCLPSDPDHKARFIAAVDDYDPPDRERDESDYETEDEEIQSSFYRQDLLKEKRNKRMKETKPLIHAAMTLPDVECAAFLKSMKTPSQDWKVVNKRRNNVLHHAATLFKLTSVRWLVDTIDLDTSLRLARNIDGYTPLEALQAELETTRVRLKKGMMTISKSDTFQGYHLDAVQCLVALQGLQDPTTDQLLHLEFGCTCGQCIQGLMSPRMKYALLAKAEIYHDMLDFEISDGPGWCEWFDYIITHVAPDIQTNFRTNKSHRKGFSNIFLYVAHCLHSDIIPNVQNVMEKLEDEGEWPPVTRGFIQRGGKVESVLQVVFEHSCDEDEKAGDGTFKNDFKEALLNLPSCRNDHEFGFLAKACGFTGVFCDYANYRCV